LAAEHGSDTRSSGLRVLVAGAGIIGMSIAEALAARGAEVIVVDRRGPGQGATRASAGMLAPFAEAEPDSPLLALGRRSLDLFDALVARLDSTGIDVHYRRSGTLQVAFDDADAKRLRAHFRQLEGSAAGAAWIDADAIAAFEPTLSPGVRGGLFVSTHGFVAAEPLLEALTSRAHASGVEMIYPAEVTAVEARGTVRRVVLANRTVEVDCVVIACGSWSAGIALEGPALRVRPVRGQLLRLQWPDADVPSRIVWGPGCYVVPWSDGTVLVGATVEDVGFDERTTSAGVDALCQAVGGMLPRARQARTIEVRAGLRPETPDGLPLIGPLEQDPRVVIACGHYRNGILLAPLTADLVSRFVLDDEMDPVLALTNPTRPLA